MAIECRLCSIVQCEDWDKERKKKLFLLNEANKTDPITNETEVYSQVPSTGLGRCPGHDGWINYRYCLHTPALWRCRYSARHWSLTVTSISFHISLSSDQTFSLLLLLAINWMSVVYFTASFFLWSEGFVFLSLFLHCILLTFFARFPVYSADVNRCLPAYFCLCLFFPLCNVDITRCLSNYFCICMFLCLFLFVLCFREDDRSKIRG